MAKRSEVQKREAKLLVKIKDSKHIDAKLRFALLATLRIAIFIEIEVVNPCKKKDQLFAHLNLAKKESFSILSEFFKNFYVTQQSNHSKCYQCVHRSQRGCAITCPGRAIISLSLMGISVDKRCATRSCRINFFR